MIVFLLLIIGIYYFSRKAMNEIFYSLIGIFKNTHFVLAIITLISLPGTIVHELSHFLVALVLLLPVKSMSIFPEFDAHEIRLGEVKFEKRDFLRSSLVGIAPFFFGVLLLISIFYFEVFPSQDIRINILMAYVIFSVSSNMFSSRQDLRDAIYIVPVILICVFVVYVFNIKLDMNLVNVIMNKVNYYLFYVLGINVGTFLFLRLFNSISKK